MKAVIDKVEFLEEKASKFGPMFSFRITYNGKSAYYRSKKKEQNKFIKGQECEFNEEEMSSQTGNPYFIVKPIYEQGSSGYSRKVKVEQARYSGFAVSYVKDLIVSGHVPFDDWKLMSQEIFDFMVQMDKSSQI